VHGFQAVPKGGPEPGVAQTPQPKSSRAQWGSCLAMKELSCSDGGPLGVEQNETPRVLGGPLKKNRRKTRNLSTKEAETVKGKEIYTGAGGRYSPSISRTTTIKVPGNDD